MDGLTFFASVIGSLAWPGAIIVFSLVFRPQVVALLDRIRKAKIGSNEIEFGEARDRFVEKLVEASPTERPVHAQAGAAITQSLAGAIRPSGHLEATVIRGGQFTIDAVVAEMRQATTPEELAERAVEYVSLRTVPGLRALSPERVRREQELFGAILELQTRRAQGATVQDAGRLVQALEQIEVFWSRPEQLGDEAVENTTALVRAVIEDMAA